MSKAAKIVILISGRGSNMTALIKACRSGEISADVVAVFSDRADAPGLQIAKAYGIDITSIERKNYSSKSEHEAAFLAALVGYEPDLICLAGFMRVLSANFVAHYNNKILNIHPSLLPKYTGLNTHARALDNNDEEHGCTVHYVIEELDGGPIVLQKSVSIAPGETEQSLADKVLAIEHQLYVDAVNSVLSRV